jgi:addiction module HigA family antidote
MGMHNPPHPGEFIREIYMEPYGLSVRRVAGSLDVSPSTLNRVLNGLSNVSPEMALRLSKALGRSPESWLAMQGQYDLWHAKKAVNLKQVKTIDLPAA